MKRGNLARFLCRSILLNGGVHDTFHSRYCYILSAKKQATLVQVDVSRVQGVISKETLLTKEISYYCFFTAIYHVWLAATVGHVRPG